MKKKKDIIERLRGPGIADYELDYGVADAAITEIERLRSALKVIHTWAAFEHGVALDRAHVQKLCEKALGNTRRRLHDAALDR